MERVIGGLFFIGDDHYLALANHVNSPDRNNPSDYNIDSKLYKWNSTDFEEFQTFATVGAKDWESFIIDNEHYLAIANGRTDTNSKIYKFNGINFEHYQSIPTQTASDWEFFTIGNDHYLAVANHRDPNSSPYRTNSKIYRWNNGSFVEFQSIPTQGAADWEFFTIGSDYYLAVANSRYGGNIGNTNSKIYKWNGSSFVEFQAIATNAGSDWEFFTIENQHYLAVANTHYNQTATHIESKIYRWNGTSFELFQAIMTNGAAEWEFFTIGREHYLALGNYYYHAAKIYSWDGSSFVEAQTFAAKGAVDWEFFTIGTDHYLAVANYIEGTYDKNQDSRIYINPLTHVVEQVESPPYDSARLYLTEPITDRHTVNVQYARRLVFTDTQELITTFRVPAGAFSRVTLDTLVSNVTTDSLTLGLDIGNDGSWDWEVSSQIDGAATLNSSDLAEAFNSYWMAQGAPLSGTLDVPVRVSLSDEGQVLLTNLVMTPALPDVSLSVSDITFGASSPIEGDTVPISATLHNPAQSDSGALTVGFYATVPDFGDWYIGSAFVPNIAANGTVEASIQWETLGFTGEVPVKVVVDPFNRLSESNEDNNQALKSMTILTRPDLMVSGIALEGAVRQGLSANVELMVHNGGETDAGLQTVSLYEGDPDDGGTLIASQIISVSTGTTATLLMAWTPTTLGTVTLYGQVDSGDVVAESDEGNNLTSQEVYVGWGAPVEIDAGGDNDQAYDPDDGYGYLAPGTVIDSCGSQLHQALISPLSQSWERGAGGVRARAGGVRARPAGEQTYREAASGEALEYQFDHLLPGRFYHLDLTAFLCSGSRELRVLVDGIEVANPVMANQEANRLSLLLDPSLYADQSIVISIEKVGGGLGGPVISELTLTDIRYCYRDSGHAAELSYAAAPDGCGWLNGVTDQSWGGLPHQSVRYQDGGNVQYLFDALESPNQYQLNLTFYENDGAGRQQSVLIDGVTALEITLANTPQDITIDLPASTYSDGTILVEIAGGSQPIISEIALEQKTLGTSSSNSTTSIPLVPGWNLISIPVHPESTVPADVLASIEDSYTLVQRYDRCNVTEPWQSYDSSAPPVTNSLTEINETMGLWIKLSVSDTLVVTGTVPISPSISLCTGWNLVGYPSLDSQPVSDALSSLSPFYTLVQAYFASEPGDKWKTFDTEVPIIINSLKNITAGQGYWIKVSQDVEWRP